MAFSKNDGSSFRFDGLKKSNYSLLSLHSMKEIYEGVPWNVQQTPVSLTLSGSFTINPTLKGTTYKLLFI